MCLETVPGTATAANLPAISVLLTISVLPLTPPTPPIPPARSALSLPPTSAGASPRPATATPVRRRPPWQPLLLVALLVAMMFAAPALGLGDRIAGLRGWIVGLGPLGPAAFVLLYAVAAALAVPASLLTVAAGAMFGSVTGIGVVAVGATLGAAAAFAIARWFARDAVVGWLGASERFRKLDALTERHGAIVVAITRLVPIFPFNLLNYGFGLTRVPFATYVLWSFLCMLPGTVLYVVGGDALARALAEGRAPWALLGVLAATLAGLALLVRRARRLLAQRESRAAAAAQDERG